MKKLTFMERFQPGGYSWPIRKRKVRLGKPINKESKWIVLAMGWEGDRFVLDTRPII